MSSQVPRYSAMVSGNKRADDFTGERTIWLMNKKMFE